MYHQRLWQQIMGSIGAEENCQDYRDNSMPESPETKLAIHSLGPSALSLSPVVGMPPVTSRPMSSNSSLSGVGGHSPASHHGGGGGSLSGRTPSPPALSAALTTAASSQQLPPACGARQLSKLKRFLTTLQQFGSDISPEIGDRVRSLVLGLVNSHLSIEEFHAKLQEATNFPLRPFVIPFLKANLPLLQRELVHCARLAKQTPQQYLSQNEHILFDAAAAAAAGGAHSPSDSSQDLSTGPPEINENGKRKSPDRPKENGFEPPDLHPAKRAHTLSPGSVGGAPAAPRVSPGNHGSFSYPGGGGSLRLEDMSLNRELRERERLERERAERERHYSYNAFSRTEHYENIDRLEDDWRQVENMLHCIVGMVDKCKRALVSLQERSHRDREEATLWMRRHLDNLDNLGKRPANEHLGPPSGPPSGPPRAGDGGERMASEAKRRAHESAVNEVKRQAVVELQKAVASAEAKASELVSSERCKMERTVLEARKQAQDEVLSKLNHQEESSESCWNCGRKASETCSGCNVARYCGSFCQHKDWENHHRVCGQGLASARILEARSERQVPSVSQPGLDRNPPPTTTPVQASSPPPPVSQGPASPPASPQGRSPPSQRPPSLGQTSPGPPASDSSSSTRQDSKPEQRSGHEQAA